MLYNRSYAVTNSGSSPDTIPNYQGTDLTQSFKIEGERDSFWLVIGGIIGLIAGPFFGFQKKPPFSYIWYGLNALSIIWGLWGASQTQMHLYAGGNKFI